MSTEEKLTKENTEGAINRLTRRIDELQGTVDKLVDKDKTREKMLEEVLASLASLKQLQSSARDHHDLVSEEIKEEVQFVKVKVANKVDEIGAALDKKKIIRLPSKSIFKKILFWR